jgi:HCOMODA/2-hydroxy-3-carboxy-muconic semialdehyde decarboxylase
MPISRSYGAVLATAGALLIAPVQVGAQTSEQGANRRDATLAELVVANHVLARLKLVDAFGHITMRDPANPRRYLMARAMAPALVTEQDIMTFDLDSNPVDAKAGSPSIERFIHGEIYKLRPDVNAVVHSHSPTVVPFSVSGTSLRPISHTGAFLSPAIPVYDPRATVGPSNLLISNQKLGRALAETLGAHTAVLIRGHGNAVVAPTVGLAVYRTYFTEVAAQLLLQAKQLDGPIKYLEPDEAAKAGDLRNTGYVRQWELWKKELSGK